MDQLSNYNYNLVGVFSSHFILQMLTGGIVAIDFWWATQRHKACLKRFCSIMLITNTRRTIHLLSMFTPNVCYSLFFVPCIQFIVTYSEICRKYVNFFYLSHTFDSTEFRSFRSKNHNNIRIKLRRDTEMPVNWIKSVSVLLCFHFSTRYIFVCHTSIFGCIC